MKWWQCSWCKWFFNDQKVALMVIRLPEGIAIEGHGCCPSCSLREFGPEVAAQLKVSQQMFVEGVR